MVYRRYTNFSNQNISFDINNLDFEHENEFIIPKVADLLGQIYLQIRLPVFSIERSDIGMDKPVSQSALSDYSTALDNYNTVVSFMVLNTMCYRAAYNTSLADNCTVDNIKNSILNASHSYENIYGPGTDATIKTSYNYILNSNFNGNFNIPVNIKSNNLINNNGIIANTPLWFLAPNYSNLLSLYSTYTDTTELMSYLNTCIDTSFRVQQYFYNIMKDRLNTLMDQLSPNIKMAFVQNLAFSMIDYISVFIGGDEIDKHDGDWFNVWYGLNGNPSQKEIFDSLIGNSLKLTTFDRNTKPMYELTLPLSFWFCRNIGLCFPLISLQNSTIRLVTKLKNLSNCIYIEKNDSISDNVGINLSDVWKNNGYSLQANYLIDYYYLDKIERRRFAESSHEYLIEIIQVESNENITSDETTIKHEMNFVGSSKELIWFFQKNAYVNNINNNYNSMWGNYSLNADGTGDILSYASIKFGSYYIIPKTKSTYFSLVQQYGNHHINYFYNGIYTYSFSLFPSEYQPSGEASLGNLYAAITFYINPNAFIYYEGDILPDGDTTIALETTLRYKLYSLKYSVLRIIGGYASLAFK